MQSPVTEALLPFCASPPEKARDHVWMVASLYHGDPLPSLSRIAPTLKKADPVPASSAPSSSGDAVRAAGLARRVAPLPTFDFKVDGDRVRIRPPYLDGLRVKGCRGGDDRAAAPPRGRRRNQQTRTAARPGSGLPARAGATPPIP